MGHHLVTEFNGRVLLFLPKSKANILLNFIHYYIYKSKENKTFLPLKFTFQEVSEIQ